MIKQGWTPAQKTQLAEVLGRAAKWRGGAQFINFVGQYFDSIADLYATDAEKQLLYEKAPDFSPLTPAELEQIQARSRRGRGRGGRGGGGGGGRGAERRRRSRRAPQAASSAVRRCSRRRSISRSRCSTSHAGQKVFEASCASCHRFGSVGTDHGVAGLNLSSSPLRASKHALLEAVFFPERKIAPALESTVVDTDRRQDDQRAGA